MLEATEEIINYNTSKYWKMMIKIKLFKSLAILINIIYCGILFLVLFELEKSIAIDEIAISIFLAMLFFIGQYYIVFFLVETEEPDTIKHEKLIKAFESVCKKAKIKGSNPKLYIWKTGGINGATWGPAVPFLYGVQLFGACIVVSEEAAKDLEYHEIEALIAHEIAHIIKMDSFVGNLVRLINLINDKRPKFFQRAPLTFRNIMFVSFTGIFSSLIPVILSIYSQEIETEADLIAVKIIGSPQPMIDLLNSIIKIDDVTETKAGFWQTLKMSHPDMHTRLTCLFELKL